MALSEDGAVLASMTLRWSHKAERGITRFVILAANEGPVKLGNPGGFTNRKLTEKVIARTGSPAKPTFHPLPLDNSMRRCSDIGLAQRKLGWELLVQLDEGLERTVDTVKGLT